jgi:hypothetical protein
MNPRQSLGREEVMKPARWLVLAISAPIAVAPAFAARWESCGTAADGAKNFYSPRSIVNDKGTVRVWERTLGTTADVEQGVSEVRRLTEFDCARNRYKALLTVIYPAEKSRPPSVRDRAAGWNDILPASPEATLAGLVCGQSQPASASGPRALP